jgi:hypothetical protein
MHGPGCFITIQLQHRLLTPTHSADPPDGQGCILEVLFQSEQEGGNSIQGSFPIISRKVRRYDGEAMTS